MYKSPRPGPMKGSRMFFILFFFVLLIATQYTMLYYAGGEDLYNYICVIMNHKQKPVSWKRFRNLLDVCRRTCITRFSNTYLLTIKREIRLSTTSLIISIEIKSMGFVLLENFKRTSKCCWITHFVINNLNNTHSALIRGQND